MAVEVPIYLSLAYIDEPDKLLVDKEHLGTRTLENDDYVELKLLLNKDNTIHTKLSFA